MGNGKCGTEAEDQPTERPVRVLNTSAGSGESASFSEWYGENVPMWMQWIVSLGGMALGVALWVKLRDWYERVTQTSE